MRGGAIGSEEGDERGGGGGETEAEAPGPGAPTKTSVMFAWVRGGEGAYD